MRRLRESDPAAAEALGGLPDPVAPLAWADWAWRAWLRLDRDRPIIAAGLAAPVPGRIPWRDVMAYADRHGHDAELLDALIISMDDACLSWHAERRAAS